MTFAKIWAGADYHLAGLPLIQSAAQRFAVQRHIFAETLTGLPTEANGRICGVSEWWNPFGKTGQQRSIAAELFEPLAVKGLRLGSLQCTRVPRVLDCVQKSFHGAVEAGAFPGFIIVAATQFAEEFWLIGGGEIFLAVAEANQAVFLAVHHQHGNFQAREFAARVVLDGAEQTNREPWINFPANLRKAREGALQDEAADWFAHTKFAGDAAAERFAVDDDVLRGETFFAQPLIRGLGVEIGSFFARLALA